MHMTQDHDNIYLLSRCLVTLYLIIKICALLTVYKLIFTIFTSVCFVSECIRWDLQFIYERKPHVWYCFYTMSCSYSTLPLSRHFVNWMLYQKTDSPTGRCVNRPKFITIYNAWDVMCQTSGAQQHWLMTTLYHSRMRNLVGQARIT